MCVSPLKIKNRSKDPLADKYLYVPCGKCLACQKTKSDGIEYRAIKEYDYCLAHGGRSYMITFTYDDEHLPRARAFKATTRIGNKFIGIDMEGYNHLRSLKEQYPELTDIQLPYPEHKDFVCHNKRDLQLFNKKLRSRLKYYGYDVIISYFIASEFGSDRCYVDEHGKRRKATSRPHYHAVYNLYPRSGGSVPSDLVFLNFAYDCWRKCSPKNFKNLLIDNKVTSAIGYIAKYINKSESNQEFAKRIFDAPCTYGIFVGDELVNVEESQIAPFTLVSKNFGAKHLLNKTVLELANLFQKSATIINANGKTYNFPFPDYYKKKFLYNTTQVSETYSLCSRIPIVQDLPNFNYTDIIDINEIILDYSTITNRKPEYEPFWLQKKKDTFDRLYSSLCVAWYEIPVKPFSEEFLKYGLYDYMVTRYSHLDIFTGECLEPSHAFMEFSDQILPVYISDYIISMFYSVASAKEHINIRNSIDYFIDEYNKSQCKFRRDKLIIIQDKAKKRAADRKFINNNRCANETSLKTLIRSHEIRMQNFVFNSKK